MFSCWKIKFWFVFIFINVLLIIVSLYLKSSVAKSSIFFNLETILIKEIFISHSKNVEIGSKDKDSK